jgi:hypothetical protein
LRAQYEGLRIINGHRALLRNARHAKAITT